MMLLPSGRSNSDVHPLKTTPTSTSTSTPTPETKPKFLTRTSSPQLTANRDTQKENGYATTKTTTYQQHQQYEHATDTAETAAKVKEQQQKTTTVPSSTTTSPSSSIATATPIGTLTSHYSHAETNGTNKNNNNNSKRNVHYSDGQLQQQQQQHCSTFLSSPGITQDVTASAAAVSVPDNAGNWEEIDRHLDVVQQKLKDGWTAHVGKEGRLYYCNHVTQTSGWLPSCEDWSKHEDLPYGWERAIDSKGRSYYINHLNKTSTYEAPESVRWDENPPEPRVVILQRSPTMGFGFVAGSERPVIVRFVTDGGPSMNKLQPGDQILAVNDEDVKEAPRDHVIQLVRACESQVTLLVCQPAHNFAPGRKSTLLSAGKRAKLRTRPSRVRFAESVCVNGAPLFPASAFSLGDICVPPMANVLKVFLENGQTKSFKYDATTSVQDVVSSLLDKLCLKTDEIFSLVLEHVKSLKRNKLTLLDPEESLARIAARPGAHKLRCLFRVSFVPISAADLAQRDLNALDYLYMQCCNDVTQERFAPELQPEVALRLAALHMHQHALANNVSPNKLTVKVVEREFGLERFVPTSLFEGMKRKELRRLISHFLKLNAEMTGSSTKVLTQLQAKLHYLDIIASLPSYGAKCFSTNQREGVERVLLVSPRFGLSQISNVRNSIPQPISAIEDFNHVIVTREDDVTCAVNIFMQGDKIVKYSMEDRDAFEFALVLSGYYRLLTGKNLSLERERDQFEEDMAPSYLAQHTVLPACWSYLRPYHNRPHSINFHMPPPYHPLAKPLPSSGGAVIIEQQKSSSSVAAPPIYAPFISSASNDLDIHSVMATALLEEAKDSGLSDCSAGASSGYGTERPHIPSNSALIEAKNEEVLRRVHEMQQMVENSEQYLNEQGELTQEYERSSNSGYYGASSANTWKGESPACNLSSNSIGVMEFDSDCESLNSSKVSSTEETPHPGVLKHSDSLVLLAEAINQDLNGITKGLNSIGGSQQELRLHTQMHSLSATSSPRPERKFNNFGQLLSKLQTLSTDFSQSESDSESVNSPCNSPTSRRPSQLYGVERRNSNRPKQNVANRSSFGLHSPDGSQFGLEAKDYNLKEYLRQLKEVSDVNQDTDLAAKKLSEIYGFEIREDTFVETDGDLIDLRAIPPPRTPDELDALSLLNAPPQGFVDDLNAAKGVHMEDADLDKFLAKVVVAPPTQKATPAKELTPEEIMSFIIPPPPNLDESEKHKTPSDPQETECLYSNALTEKRGAAFQSKNIVHVEGAATTNGKPTTTPSHIIEYATVERKGKFSCCPKSKREDTPPEVYTASDSEATPQIELPPRNVATIKRPPMRPPKSAELLQRFAPRQQINNTPTPKERPSPHDAEQEQKPPVLPPRVSSPNRYDECCTSPTVSSAPKKPPLPLVASRTLQRHAASPTLPHSPLNSGPAAALTPPPTPPRPFPVSTLSIRPSDMPQHQHQHHQQQPQPHSPHGPASNGTLAYRLNQNTRAPSNLVCSPQLPRKMHSPAQISVPLNNHNHTPLYGDKLIIKNGHVIDGEALLAKTDIAMAGLLVKLDQVAAQCTAAQSAGGGSSIDEDKFQRARNELTEQTLVLVTASKFLVVAMSDMTLSMLPEHLTSCLTAIRRITELTQDMTRHTSAPLQTRNIVLKVHDVASSFRELVGVQIGPLGAGQLALQAECLANVLATLLRSLRVFSP